MQFTVLTLFPEILRSYFEQSIMAKAVAKGIISYELVNIRDYADDVHRTCDDSPYGGGAGQLMLAEPLGKALDAVNALKKNVIYVTPAGKPFSQAKAKALSGEKELVIIAGRYEGIDERIVDLYVDETISIGDYVLSSGEVAAEVVIDAVYRLIDGVISAESLEEESYAEGLLEYPQYTKPQIYKGLQVPCVLLSGNHEAIRKWRLKKRIEKTIAFRPDLLFQSREAGLLSDEAEKIILELTEQSRRKKTKRSGGS